MLYFLTTNRFGIVSIALVAALLCGCAPAQTSNNTRTAARGSMGLKNLDLADLVTPAATDQPVALAAARNEWTSFTLQVTGLRPADNKTAFVLRMQPLNQSAQSASIDVGNISAYQILSMPIDVNRAGYVRHTGQTASTRMLPRALLPLPVSDGGINLSAARDPAKPTDAASRAGQSDQPVMLWFDIHVPPQAPAGIYESRVDLYQTGGKQPLASLPIRMEVYDFVLPDDRHLAMVGQVEWESLTRLFPSQFEAITDRLLNRQDPRYAPAVQKLDELVTLAQAHRTQLVFTRLQPTVKWPGGRPPQVAWEDYDSVVTPWLSGEMFPDKVPPSFWLLPQINGLANYDRKSQNEYWTEAASHFNQNDWLTRSAVMISKSTPGRADTQESLALSAEAAAILRAHPYIRVCLPLEDDQLAFESSTNPGLIDPTTTARLITANPGIVFASPMSSWPKDVARPPRWLRTDLTGLIPYIGAGGDERDVRLWAWLAFVPLPPPSMGVEYGPMRFIRWVGVLPRASAADQPADPNDLIWFYPGSWFGVEAPLPTIQLKWLRRAQQDFEYLYLARQRGDRLNALLMSRLITKPIEIQPGQAPDPTFGLMSGTANPQAWTDAKALLAERILLRQPGEELDKQRDYDGSLRILRWSEPQERPVILGRSTGWTWERASLIGLRLGIDIYNASDSRPDENGLQWTPPLPSGWEVRPYPITIPALGTYHVRRELMEARIDPAKLRNRERIPTQVTFTNGFTRKTSLLKVMLPVAASDRREGGGLQVDGALNDWSPDDAILDGPLVRMFNRPAIQAGEIQNASTPTQIFTAWADENLYLGFKVSGLTASTDNSFRNFLSYQFRRAWGEDLCQVVIQPVYDDSSVGPVLHLICKRGSCNVERKMDPRLFADPWQPIEGAGVRYAATIDGADWRGEIAVPWKAINQPGKGMPIMLRFNFIQHRDSDGESASWAGPIDFGRDDAFTGVLFMRESNVPGVAGK